MLRVVTHSIPVLWVEGLNPTKLNKTRNIVTHFYKIALYFNGFYGLYEHMYVLSHKLTQRAENYTIMIQYVSNTLILQR